MARNQQVEEPQQHEEAQQYIEAASKIVILHGQKFPVCAFSANALRVQNLDRLAKGDALRHAAGVRSAAGDGWHPGSHINYWLDDLPLSWLVILQLSHQHHRAGPARG